MNKIIYGIVLFSFLGCIKNDIPYPVIFGNVERFEVEGQTECIIYRENRLISITLSEDVDIYNVKVNEFSITEDATTTLLEDTLDLSKNYKFTISTYQDYEWTIETTQPMEYYWNIENQVGNAIINHKEKKVIAYIPEGESRRNIDVKGLKLGPPSAIYSPDPHTLRDFAAGQTIKVNFFNREEIWELYVFTTNIIVSTDEATDIWAKSAVLSGKMKSGSTDLPGFQYRKSTESNWIDVNIGDITVNSGTFQARISNLSPATTYVFKALLGDEEGEEMNFTTENADQIPNMNFDSWCTVKSILYPNLDLSEQYYWWDTGNRGGAMASKTPTEEEKKDVVKGSAANLHTEMATISGVGKLAAGNIFLGKYLETLLSPMGGRLEFGREYTCRPTTLSGYYKYNPGIINVVEKGYEHLQDVQDSCHIYIALCDWTTPFEVNTATSTFIDFSDNRILAYGELKDSRKMNKYEKFEIKLEYRTTTRKPTYIVLVATSSKYGDYFTGSTNSVLLLDEFELGFD